MEQIRLDALTIQQFGVTPEEANGLIMAGRIWIGHVPADKAGLSVPADTVLTLIEKPKKYASRSGYKLAKALEVFSQSVTGLTVCDIGASNGGFTDCLLQNGAAHVFSVDVAYGILAWELRNDERVTVLERTNARRLTAEQLGTLCDAVTVDVSFISLKKIYPAIRAILKEDGVCICLIKPQFEAAQRQLGKNGVLRDPAADLPPLLTGLFDAAADNGLYLQNLTVSPIHGTNGNVEYLARFMGTPTLDTAAVQALVDDVLTLQPDDVMA